MPKGTGISPNCEKKKKDVHPGSLLLQDFWLKPTKWMLLTILLMDFDLSKIISLYIILGTEKERPLGVHICVYERMEAFLENIFWENSIIICTLKNKDSKRQRCRKKNFQWRAPIMLFWISTCVI